MSTLQVEGIRNAAQSSDAISLASNGSVSIAATCSISKPVTALQDNQIKLINTISDTNLIINPHMQVNQRESGTLTVNSSTSQWPVDRWVSRGEGGSRTFTVEQVSVASSGLGVRNAVKITSSQAGTVTSNDIFNFRQMIEGYNTQRLNLGEAGCQSMTLSFTVRSSVAGTHSGAIQNSGQNRSYPFTYTLVANTWTDVTITIPPITDGSSWNETNGVGVRVVFDMGSGDNFRGTANQWNSAQDEGATGAVRILETNGATWEVTKVQFEEGTIKSPTQKRSYGDELSKCQRYFWLVSKGETGKPFGTIIMYSNTSARINYFFPVSMRAAPSLYEVTGTNYWSIIVDGGQSQSDNIENTIYGTTDYTHVIITDDVSSSGGKVGWIENLNAAARLGFNAEF
tara:strand:+ start:5270 stop:6466 length:1197 start_codon:yes stop_codon:yes gene_type:complete